MRTSLMLMATAFLIATAVPTNASHTETHETGWFESKYNGDDDGVLYCSALGVIGLGGPWYLHDRPGPGATTGTGMLSAGGGGVYIFEETNGIPGIQIGSTSTVETTTGIRVLEQDVAQYTFGVGFGDPFDDECPNGDTLLFAADSRVEVGPL